MVETEIFEKLLNLTNKAYAPYSHFYVAAIIESIDEFGIKNYYYGINVENMSYGATICAERAAITNWNVNKENDEKITHVYILAKRESGYADKAMPCGICRTVLSEFCLPDVPVTCYDINGESITHKMSELMPFPFVYPDETENKEEKRKMSI